MRNKSPVSCTEEYIGLRRSDHPLGGDGACFFSRSSTPKSFQHQPQLIIIQIGNGKPGPVN